MNETQVTLTGRVGNDVSTRSVGEAVVCSFRLASTPRRLNRATGEWYDGATQWFTVNAWRTLGEHCAASLRRGDPVVLHGRLTTATWVNAAGVEMSSTEVEAAFVGHDLNRGTSHFARARRPSVDRASEPGGEPADGVGDGVADGAVGGAGGTGDPVGPGAPDSVDPADLASRAAAPAA